MASRIRSRLVLAAWLVLPFAAAVAHGAAAPAARDRQLGAAFDRWARPLSESGHLSGQLLVARGGEVLFERFYGWSNFELRTPVTPETRFCVASVTKPMTVLLAIRMIEEKRMATGDSIARWIPDFPAGERITIGHLLQHRSGIPHELVPDSEATMPRTAADMVELAKRRPLDFEPGSKRGYSTGGFSVLARVLELAGGSDYASLLRRHLFEPLGMNHSSHADGRMLLPGRADDYVPTAHGIENALPQDFSGLVGGGSVYSTARDLHRFVQGVVTGKLGASMRQSFVRGGRLDFSGRTGGFRANAEWDSTTGLEVIFVGNLVTGAPDLLRAGVRQLAAGETPPPPAIPTVQRTPVPAERLKRYEGVFQLENGLRLTFAVVNGALYANQWPLLPIGDDRFFSPRDYGEIRGFAGADGRIERIEWVQEGKPWPAPRVEG